MQIVVAGGTGFIGQALARQLVQAGHRVTVLTRGRRRESPAEAGAYLTWPEGTDWQATVAAADAVVNLAGAPIAAGRWTARRKDAILKSRLAATHALISAMATSHPRPQVLVNASAVGYYGDSHTPGDESAPPGNDFLAAVCSQWEEAAREAEPLGVRVVRVRIGVVLHPSGGALPKLLLPFRLFAGGPMGSGRQGFPWIHIDDVVGLIRFALENAAVSGPVNAVAPQQVDNATFCRALGRTLGRPSWLPVPGFALQLALGEMATMLLTGQFLAPAAAQKAGYRFRFPELSGALSNLLKN